MSTCSIRRRIDKAMLRHASASPAIPTNSGEFRIGPMGRPLIGLRRWQTSWFSDWMTDMLATSESIANTPCDVVEQPSALVLESTQARLELAPILLKPGKWTIGSAVGCKPRLQVAGIQPRHCLIVSSGERTLLKAWSARTWLNDKRTKEAILRSGDRLVIGPIEFLVRHPTADELLEQFPDAKCTVRPPSAATGQIPSSGNGDAVGRDQDANFEERHERLAAAERAVAHAQRDLAHQYAQLESDRAILDAARRGLEDERERCAQELAELLEGRRELDRRWEQLERREAALALDAGDRQNSTDAQAAGCETSKAIHASELLVLTESPESAEPNERVADATIHREPDGRHAPEVAETGDAMSVHSQLAACRDDDGDSVAAPDLDSPTRDMSRSMRFTTAQVLNRMRWMLRLKSTIAAIALSAAVALLTSEIWGEESYSRAGWAAAMIGVIATIEAGRTTLTVHRLNRVMKTSPRQSAANIANR